MIYDSRDILKNILYIGYGNTHQNITIVETNGISQKKNEPSLEQDMASS